MLQLSARQQVPDLNAVDTFFSRHIRKSYEQLNNSYEEIASITSRRIIEVTLLYDDFSNSSIIEQSISDIYTKDPDCYVMTIRDLEILLYTHKHDMKKCEEFCTQIATNVKGAGERASIGAILEKLDLICNPHLEGDMDFFTKLSEQLEAKIK